MQYMNNIFSNVRGLYSRINSTPICGAIDIIVIEQPDGSFKATPLRIVFGMLGVFNPRHQPIDMKVNNDPVPINLRLGEFGEAYLPGEDSKCDIVRCLSTGTLDSLLLKESGEGIRQHSSFDSDCVFTDKQEKPEYKYFELTAKETEAVNGSNSIFPGIQMSLCGDLHNSEDSLLRFNSCLVSREDFIKSPTSILSNKRLVFLFEERFYSWHSIGPLLVSMAAFGVPLPQICVDSLNCYPQKSKRRQALNWIFGSDKPKYSSPNPQTKADSYGDLTISDCEMRLITSDSELESPSNHRRSRPFDRPNILNSDQITSLNLLPGCNEASFSITTAFQGTCTVTCKIFKWSYSDKLVVSDIDGTITKTDVLGHVLPLVGMNWCHDHVIPMCRAISDNGYRIIYLSSRSIAQSAVTSQFIHKVRQDGLSLPRGPIMLSPYGLFQAFNREVILKCPQEFKISCLREIVALFPPEYPLPIVGGFGNRDTDETTYRSLGVSPSRIFIIDPKSRVVIPNFVKLNTSYMNVNDYVDAMFPFHDGQKTHIYDEYINCNYWRFPFPKI